MSDQDAADEAEFEDDAERNAHASAVAAQLRLAEKKGTLPDEVTIRD